MRSNRNEKERGLHEEIGGARYRSYERKESVKMWMEPDR